MLNVSEIRFVACRNFITQRIGNTTKEVVMNLFTGPFEELELSVNSDMATIVRAMARPDSGLEIRDRMWLKITIPNAFIGADVVDWLHHRVKGFIDR